MIFSFRIPDFKDMIGAYFIQDSCFYGVKTILSYVIIQSNCQVKGKWIKIVCDLLNYLFMIKC